MYTCEEKNDNNKRKSRQEENMTNMAYVCGLECKSNVFQHIKMVGSTPFANPKLFVSRQAFLSSLLDLNGLILKSLLCQVHR